MNTIADLKALNTDRISDGINLYVSGYNSVVDGGGGVFTYDANSVADDDGGSVIEPDAGNGRYHMVLNEGRVNARRFGATGDGTTDDKDALQRALDANLGPVYLPRGTYLLSSSLYILHNNSGLIGESPVSGNQSAPTIITLASGVSLYVGNVDGAYAQNASLRDLYLLSTAGTAYAVRAACFRNLKLFNVAATVRNGIKVGEAGKTITGAANNGSGGIRITCTGHNYATSGYIYVNRVGGVTAATGGWTITVIDADHFDLNGSTFAGTYTSGGMCAPHCLLLECSGSGEWSINDTHAIDVYNLAGSLYLAGVGTFFNNDNFTGLNPTAGTYGIRVRRGTNVYDRVDHIKVLGATVTRFDYNFAAENTRVVSIEFDSALLDGFLTAGVAVFTDSVDDTGGGSEDISINNCRFGLHTTDQLTAVYLDASGASVRDIKITGNQIVAKGTAIDLIGGAAWPLGVQSVVISHNYFEMRPTSAIYGIRLDGRCDRVQICGNNLWKESGAGSVQHGVLVKSTATGAVMVTDLVTDNTASYSVSIESGCAAAVLVANIKNATSGDKFLLLDPDRVALTAEAPGIRWTRKRQSFMVSMQNNGGTMRHRMSSIMDDSTAAVSQFIEKIIGATTSWSNTPNGANASTAFAGGIKINSADTSQAVLDTADQSTTGIDYIDMELTMTVVRNDTGIPYTLMPRMTELNINGTATTRPAMVLFHGTTGVASGFETANIPSGKTLWIVVTGWFR